MVKASRVSQSLTQQNKAGEGSFDVGLGSVPFVSGGASPSGRRSKLNMMTMKVTRLKKTMAPTGSAKE